MGRLVGIDRNILCEVTDLVKTLFNIQGKPKRITIGKVEMKIEKLSLLEKYLNKLPLTKNIYKTI